jgi:hypothetical protein
MMKFPVILALSASVITTGLARADEMLKFRLFMHVTGVQTHEVPDVDGHTMSAIKFTGLASFPDGAVGTATLVATTDYIKGSGTFSNYVTVNAKDGSTLTYKMTNAPAKTEGAVTIFPEAPATVVRGTGRWDGVKGDGSQNGARLTPLAAGAELYVDATLNLKK